MRQHLFNVARKLRDNAQWKSALDLADLLDRVAEEGNKDEVEDIYEVLR